MEIWTQFHGPLFLSFSIYLPIQCGLHTLGSQIVSGDISWDNFRLEGVPMPLGYYEWAADILNHHSLQFKGNGPRMDYIYGAIFCSLGKYFVSPPLIKAMLERWDPHTNTFLFPWGERTITLMDMHKMAGLPLEGDSYDEFIPPSADFRSHSVFVSKILVTGESLLIGIDHYDDLSAVLVNPLTGEITVLSRLLDCFHGCCLSSFATDHVMNGQVDVIAVIWVCAIRLGSATVLWHCGSEDGWARHMIKVSRGSGHCCHST